MTEQEYLSWTRPTAILKCLGPRATLHQYVLFFCAIWRRDPGVCRDAQSLRAVELVERFCFEEVTFEEVRPHLARLPFPHLEFYLNAANYHARRIQGESIIGQLGEGQRGTGPSPVKLAQASLLRCVVGNPFTPAGIHPAWLRWNGGAVPSLAETIHRERRFDELPVLADALEEAGCDDGDLLGHCRTRREHAPGCWVLSLLRSRLAVRLVLSEPEARLSGWRPDTVELENVSAGPVTVAYEHGPFERLTLLTLDASGEVAQQDVTPFAEGAWAPAQTIALGPGGTLRHHLGPTRSLPPGIYTMQALFRHAGLDVRSRAFLFTVPREA